MAATTRMGRPRVLDEGFARFLLRLPADLFNDLGALADKRKNSLNTLLVAALERFLESQPERDQVANERAHYRRRRAAERAAKTRRRKARR